MANSEKPRIPRLGNGVTDRVRICGVPHEIQTVRGDGTRIYLNIGTGEEVKLSKAEQLQLIGRGDYFTEPQWPKGSDAEVEERLKLDWQLTTENSQEYAVFKAKFLRELDRGHHSPAARRSKTVLKAVIKTVMADDTSGFSAPNYKTIRRYWDPLWLVAKNLRVLAPNFAKCGNWGKDPEFAELDALTEQVLEEKIAQDGGILSISALTAYVDAKVGILAEERGLKLRPGTRPDRAVGKNHVRKLIDKKNLYDQSFRNLARKEIRRHGQGITIGPSGEYPLHQVEVDHTPMDILLKRPGQKPARPWITALIDRYSRYILGFYICFDAPSWYSVAMALRLAVVPKQAYLKSLDYAFRFDWLAFGCPDYLIMDQGPEFQCAALEWAASDLNISLDDMEAAKGSDKGKIERWLGTLQREVCMTMPGYTSPNITTRDLERAVAEIDLDECERLVAAYIVDKYHQRVHGTTERKPHDLYIEAMNKMLVVKPPPSEDILGPLASPLVQCTATVRGITLDGERYWSDELHAVVYERGGKLLTVVRPDPLDADTIQVRGPAGWIKATLMGDRAGDGLTREQASRRRKLKAMPSETAADIRKRREALLQFEDMAAGLRQRSKRKANAPKTPPKKPGSFMNRPVFDAAASQAGLVGYAPDAPVPVDRYTGAGPFAEKSLATRANASLPVAGVDPDEALNSIASREAKGRQTPRSTPLPQPHQLAANSPLHRARRSFIL